MKTNLVNRLSPRKYAASALIITIAILATGIFLSALTIQLRNQELQFARSKGEEWRVRYEETRESREIREQETEAQIAHLKANQGQIQKETPVSKAKNPEDADKKWATNIYETNGEIVARRENYPPVAGEKTVLTDFLFQKETGMIVAIQKGEKYCEDPFELGYQKILKVITPEKKEKILYTTKKTNHTCNMTEGLCCLSLSPDGKYVMFNKTGWESMKAYMMNIETGKFVVEDDYDIISMRQMVWAPDNKNYAFTTNVNRMGGAGVMGVYVSEHNNPDSYKRVWTAENDLGTSIKELKFTRNNVISFTVEIREGGLPDSTVKKMNFLYDFEDDKLK